MYSMVRLHALQFPIHPGSNTRMTNQRQSLSGPCACCHRRLILASIPSLPTRVSCREAPQTIPSLERSGSPRSQLIVPKQSARLRNRSSIVRPSRSKPFETFHGFLLPKPLLHCSAIISPGPMSRRISILLQHLRRVGVGPFGPHSGLVIHLNLLPIVGMGI